VNKMNVGTSSASCALKTFKWPLSYRRMHSQCVPQTLITIHYIQLGRVCQANGLSFHRWIMVYWLKLPEEALWQYRTNGHSIKLWT
jgi:hypothetical protein